MECNLFDVLVAVAAEVPDRDAIVQGERRCSYRQLVDRAERVGSVLAAAGLGVRTEREHLADHESGQSHVAVLARNCPEWLEMMLGAAAARAAAINVNFRYTADELAYLLDDAGAEALVFQSSYAAVVGQVLARLAVRPTVLLQLPDDSGEPLLAGARWYEDALADAPAVPLPTRSPDDLYVLYTGGTTGQPKGVLWRQADAFMAMFGGRRSDGSEWESMPQLLASVGSAPQRLLPAPPFMHGAAQWIAVRALTNGHTVVIQEVTDRFDAGDVLHTIERHQVTFLLVIGDSFLKPFIETLETTGATATSLRTIVTGGAFTSASVKQQLVERLPHVVVQDSAGSSETGGQLRQVTGADTADDADHRFEVRPGACVISDARDRVITSADDGMGWLASHGRIPLGYLGDPARTASTFPVIDGVRYSVPGDRVRITGESTVQLLGRESVTINSGGEKIFAEEVELAIGRHPSVADVVVCGRPSERWGSEVVAVVALKAPTADSELLGYASERLARYKLPKAIVRVPAIRRSAAGKADYAWARQLALGADTETR